MATLEKLLNLQAKVKDLESCRSNLEKENENITKDTLKKKSDANREITKQKEDFDIYKRGVEQNHKKIETSLTNREKERLLKEKEGRDLDADIQDFNKKKRSFAQEKKDIEKLKSEYIDREYKANLLIAQYNKMTGELPQEKPKVEKISKKKKKR
ncbi:hypothetical protein LCGC14_0435020 [marine sediment metagenome]|uniref:Uncharacterized protein n=1 Tax=marine sediment metagenome TaxID=412755 RepID=A0A0F9SM15_9ZZZZ